MDVGRLIGGDEYEVANAQHQLVRSPSTRLKPPPTDDTWVHTVPCAAR